MSSPTFIILCLCSKWAVVKVVSLGWYSESLLAVGNCRYMKKNRSSPECEGFHNLHQCMVSVFYDGFVCPESVHPFLSRIQHILLWAVLQCHYTSWEKLLFPLNIMNLLSLAFVRVFWAFLWEEAEVSYLFSFLPCHLNYWFHYFNGLRMAEGCKLCALTSVNMRWIGSRLSSLCLWMTWF